MRPARPSRSPPNSDEREREGGAGALGGELLRDPRVPPGRKEGFYLGPQDMHTRAYWFFWQFGMHACEVIYGIGIHLNAPSLS
jgi:hypothetical protein